ncbi:MAG TPA: dihydropyrimidine dehydrogenase [Parvularcula sp.]|nr:dihydropyrimidine dehydrogenase [Parvularcula sp.]HBS31351.1 dihydropyrimidine dehydrogenase [Parvularcula sp.]
MKRLHQPAPEGALSSEAIAENFSDLHPPLAAAQAAVEASRCLYCYDAPCIKACPTGIDIPKFIHQIRTGNIDGSATTILSENIMGGTCARACPTETLCEEVCVVNRTQGGPVKIGALQRFAVDRMITAGGPHPFQRMKSSGRRFAVVGAGPAGLSFAHRAAMLGHRVIVYEARPKPGGLNEYGLAAYKMAEDFAQAEVAFLLQIGGIEIEYGKALGRELTLDGLRGGHDCVFIGAGLGGAGLLGVPGETLSGVRDALDFIAGIRQAGNKSSVPVGNDVIVIGGGNTAIDAAMQAKCLGAARVTLVYRRGQEAMGATAWEQELAAANGVVMRFWASPAGFSGVGRVERARFEETRIEGGALAPAGRWFDLPADMVLKAIGQKFALAAPSELRLERGRIWVDEQFRTSIAGVYAGGDCIHRGEDLTVRAVEDGKQAAMFADAHLRDSVKGASR